MNRKKLVQLLTLILIGSFLAACGPTPTTGKIEGRVFRSDTNEPITNASVSLNRRTSGESKEIAKTTTDAQGNYSFTEVEPGVYSLSAGWSSTCNGPDFFFQNGWAVIVSAGGELVATLEEEATVAAGDALQKNLDLDLKFCPQ